jgi:two-component system cell cycle sensor histidine kinase/response regulator CckA
LGSYSAAICDIRLKAIQPQRGDRTKSPPGTEHVRVLHLEDSSADAALILDTLKDGNLACAVTHALTKLEFEAAVEREPFDIILCDHSLPDYSGFAALEFAKQRQPQVPFIILSGALDDAQAVQSLKNGATDYILKERMARLVPAIRRALEEAEERRQKAASEDRIREQANLLNLTRDAILVRTMEDRIVFWNAGAETLFGWSAEEALGQDFAGLLGGDLALLGGARGSLLKSGDWLGEIQLKGKSGEEITVMSRWNLLRDKDGQPQAILSTNTDVTEKKKLEAVVLRAQRMESIGSLAGGIAHDLNNALAPVLLSAALMETCQDAAERHQYVEVIVSSVQRGARMLKKILNFTAGRGLCIGPVAVSDQVREMEKLARDIFPKSIVISVNTVGSKLWTIRGDPMELHQVLLNLCVNARDAMPEGGQLILSVKNVNLNAEEAARLQGLPGPCVMLSVADTGGGIPPKVLSRIFEPFFTTKPPEQGTGLGLSIVARIMQNYGGRIGVHTEVGKGTEFRLYFPALESAAAAEAPGEKTSLPAGHGELVLLMEDEEAVRELTKISLEHFGYRVVTAPNGQQGLARFGEYREKIRVVITDMDMPEMNGLAAVRAIKEQSPDLPVIIASGTRQAPEELQRMQTERMTHLGKPYSLEQLLAGVAAALKG